MKEIIFLFFNLLTTLAKLLGPSGRTPGPKGPSAEVIEAIVMMKQRNS
jgi:ribosomal protein L1